MSTNGRVSCVAMAMATIVALGCGGGSDIQTGSHQITFMGAVVDGASGMPIKDYSINLVYGSHTVKGKVDATTGRYVVGPLPAWNDYGILIDAGTGYRAFSSYNAAIPPPTPPAGSLSSDVYKSNTTQTFDFDAVLFPTSITAPDVTINVVKNTIAPNPSAADGSYRLQPMSVLPAIQSQPTEITGQTWTNDNDIFAAVVSGAFTGGKFTVPGASLLFGVTYQVTIYGVEGFQTNGTTITAGTGTGAMVTVVPQTVLPVALKPGTTTPTCTYGSSTTATSTAIVTIVFNQNVEDGTTTTGGAKEIIDNGFYAYSSSSSLVVPTTPSATVQEHGTTTSFSGDTLTMSWNPNVGLATHTTGDIVMAAQYGSLSTVYVQPVGHPDARISLSQVMGFLSTLYCSSGP